MHKKILFISALILIFLIIFLTYFSIYGIKTNSLNSFINKKVNEYNSKLTIQVDEVYIKLNIKEFAININTEKSNLIDGSNLIKIANIDINLNLIKFFKNENSVKNVKITSSINSIKNVTSILNTLDYNLPRYIFYSQIKKGLINFELNIEFDKTSQDIYSYFISGSVIDGKLNIPGYDNFNNINFNFQTQDKKTKFSNLNFSYLNVDFLSKEIEVDEDKSGGYLIKGDIQNNKALINPNSIFKFINIKLDYFSNKKILLQSKNLFTFKFSKKKKIENIKIETAISFDEVYFNNKYLNQIFLKRGTINAKFENEQLTAELYSNFGFTDNLKSKNDLSNNNLKLFLKSEKGEKIEINGNISHDKVLLNPKILFSLINLDPKLLSDKKINIQTDNKFKFDFKNGRVEDYFVNSEINVDKLELNEKIQDIIYLKNIKTNLTLGHKILKIDLNSNFSFLDKKFDNKSENNIINLKLNKNGSKVSNVNILVKTGNNNINTDKFKKFLTNHEIDELIEDQLINLNLNLKINALIDETYNIQKLDIKSDLDFDNLNINYKSNLIKNYIRNYNSKFKIKNSKILFEYSNQIINFQLQGKYLLNNKSDNIFIKFNGKQNDFELYSLLNLKNSILNFDEVQYFKEKNIPSELEVLINNSKSGINFKTISFKENQNFISAKNLLITNDLKIKSVDQIDVNFLNNKSVLNNLKIIKNSNKYQIIGSQIDGERIIEKILKNNSKNKISNFFKNLNTTLIFNIDKIFLEKDEYLRNFDGEFDIKNNKLIIGKANANLERENKFTYSYRTTAKNEKITNILIEEPKPFINNYKFIKGFEEGVLKLNSLKIDNNSRSNLKINNFKVKEVPVLAKILTLASLQGIADLLTGEGIRFDKFEMDFKTKNNLTEIDEMYAIGPAISIMMEGYIEKDRITSLRGTLVPATTINKTISKIPLLGNILVGSKAGEGVFGVSFKIKGPPNDLKSTVNPIKTLTPRFITRTLENLKG